MDQWTMHCSFLNLQLFLSWLKCYHNANRWTKLSPFIYLLSFCYFFLSSAMHDKQFCLWLKKRKKRKDLGALCILLGTWVAPLFSWHTINQFLCLPIKKKKTEREKRKKKQERKKERQLKRKNWQNIHFLSVPGMMYSVHIYW